MDPNKTLRDMLDDISWEDWKEARMKYADLQNWLDKGGYEPAWLVVIGEFISE